MVASLLVIIRHGPCILLGYNAPMRPWCLDCTIKHIAQAYVNHNEHGYPDHIMAAIGHLAEAAEECVGVSPDLAGEIRKHRLEVMARVVELAHGAADVDVPYVELFMKAVSLRSEKGCGSCRAATDKLRSLVAAEKAKDVPPLPDAPPLRRIKESEGG